MIDFHCHLDLYPNPEEVASEAQRRGIGVLSLTTTPSAWPGTVKLSRSRPAIKTAIGLHPQLARERKHELSIFERYLAETRFVGEVGLDGSPQFKEIWQDQLEVFDFVLTRAARTGDKIISIHSRRAASVVLDKIERQPEIGTPILHWFSGTSAELVRAIALGCWFSIGPAMLAGAKGRSLVEKMPRDRVLLETDGPFTRINGLVYNPWDATLAIRGIAQAWAISPGKAADTIRSNELKLLRYPR